MNKSILVEAECVDCAVKLTIGASYDELSTFDVHYCPSCRCAMACFNHRDLDDWTFESSKLLDDNKVVAAIKHCREKTGPSSIVERRQAGHYVKLRCVLKICLLTLDTKRGEMRHERIRHERIHTTALHREVQPNYCCCCVYSDRECCVQVGTPHSSHRRMPVRLELVADHGFVKKFKMGDIPIDTLWPEEIYGDYPLDAIADGDKHSKQNIKTNIADAIRS
jgi:hypothetical protein